MIRRLVAAGADLWARLAAIHATSFEHGWSAQEFERLAAATENRLHISESDGVVAGFILVTVVAGEGEILTLATAPEYRGQGHAGRLLSHLAEILAGEAADAIFLEVAVDNAAALALYERSGFKSAGLRKAYYSRTKGPPVDARILRLALG